MVQSYQMAYSADFWIAVAASAPIIALANVTSVSVTMGTWRKTPTDSDANLDADRGKKLNMRLTAWALTIIVLNTWLQAGILFLALFSLATGTGKAPILLPLIAEPAGVLALTGSTNMLIIARPPT